MLTADPDFCAKRCMRGPLLALFCVLYMLRLCLCSCLVAAAPGNYRSPHTALRAEIGAQYLPGATGSAYVFRAA